MSEQANKFHEEEAIGKTYDFRVAKRLLSYLKPYWHLAAAALTLTVLANVLFSLQPRFTQMAVDDYITPKQTEGIWIFAFAFFGVFLFRFIFSYIQEIFLNTVGQKVMFDIRTQIYTKLQNQEVSYYDKNPVGRIITRITSDVDALNELFTSGVIDVLGDLVIILRSSRKCFGMIGSSRSFRWSRFRFFSPPPIGFANAPAKVSTKFAHATLNSTLFSKNTFRARKPFSFSTPKIKRSGVFKTSTTITATQISKRSIIIRYSIRSSILSARSELPLFCGSAVINSSAKCRRADKP